MVKSLPALTVDVDVVVVDAKVLVKRVEVEADVVFVVDGGIIDDIADVNCEGSLVVLAVEMLEEASEEEEEDVVFGVISTNKQRVKDIEISYYIINIEDWAVINSFVFLT